MGNPRRGAMRRAALREQLAARRLPWSIAALNLTKAVNIGGLIRAANAFLLREVIYVGAAEYAKSAAVGAHHIETVIHLPDVAAFERWLDEQRRPLVAIEQDAAAVPLQTAEPPRDAVLLLGQELYGTPPGLLRRAVMRIEIPQFGSVGSLNVAMAATVVMYELASREFLGRAAYALPPASGFTPGGKPKRNAAARAGAPPPRRSDEE